MGTSKRYNSVFVKDSCALFAPTPYFQAWAILYGVIWMLQGICRLSWSISSHFGTIHSWNACRSLKSRKNLLKPLSRGSRLFKVIDVDIPK